MEDNRPRYKGICPVCGAVLWICPSIAMIKGWHNGGHGACFQCNTFLHLIYKPDEKEFEAEIFDNYVQREKKKYDKLKFRGGMT